MIKIVISAAAFMALSVSSVLAGDPETPGFGSRGAGISVELDVQDTGTVSVGNGRGGLTVTVTEGSITNVDPGEK